MYRVPPGWAWRHAVGAQLERGVRPHWRENRGVVDFAGPWLAARENRLLGFCNCLPRQQREPLCSLALSWEASTRLENRLQSRAATDLGRIMARDSQTRFFSSGLPGRRVLVLCIRPLCPELCAPYFGAPNVLISGLSRASRSAHNELISWRREMLRHVFAGLFGISAIVGPNVRATRATAAGRQARAGENVPRTASPGLVACRWRAACARG